MTIGVDIGGRNSPPAVQVSIALARTLPMGRGGRLKPCPDKSPAMTIGKGYADALAAEHVGRHWADMSVSLRSAATLSKFFIANGSAGSSDLSAPGFHLLRTGKQRDELTDILNK
jgi:hypothetical protein